MPKCELKVNIAGINFGISSDKSYPLEWLRQSYGSYLTGKKAEVKVQLFHRRQKIGLIKNQLFSEPYNIYGESGFNFRIYHKKNYVAAGDILRLLISFILTQRAGFLMHSCGLIINKSAYLFAGPSGAGKTTIARLVDNGYALLSDETTAVIKEGKDYYASATPFFGDFGRITSNLKAPLKAIFFLKKSHRFYHQRINSVDAVGHLIQNIFLLGDYWRNNHGIQTIMDIAFDVSRKIPLYELEFLPDKRIWKYIEKKIFLGAG